jgi:sorbitol-specific phosphotransferase system component IIA
MSRICGGMQEAPKRRNREEDRKHAGWLMVGDRFNCAGLVYRIVAVGTKEIFALREDDTGSITLRILDDAPVELLP